METDEDKHLPEKSPRFSSKDAGDNNNNKKDNKNTNNDNKDKPLTDQEPGQQQPENQNEIQTKDSDNNNPPQPEQPPTEGESATLEDAETEIKEDESVERTVETLDIAKLSEEVDQFISALSSKEKSDEEESQPPEVPEFLEKYAFFVEAKIANYDSIDSPLKWSHLTEEDTAAFLETVHRVFKLSTSLCKLSAEEKYASSINHISGVLQRAMSYLEEELRSILDDYKIPDRDQNSEGKTKQSSSSSGETHETEQNEVQESEPAAENYFLSYSDDLLSKLNVLVKAAMSGGHETECCQIYFIARRNALEESLTKLGFEKFSIDDVQKMHWESLEREIVAWIKTFKECASVIFPSERKLALAVFSENVSLAESLFGSLSRRVTIQLVNFAEAITMTKRSAEKLFKYLDVYETLRDMIPAMDGVFQAEYVEELKSEASLTRSRLGEAIIYIFCGLENSIKADTAKTPVPGGAVHPLTRYTMNYLKYACEYKDTLEQVFGEHQKIDRADSTAGSDYDCNNTEVQGQNNNKPTVQSPFEFQLAKVMDLLDANLESKSKVYKDTSLSLIFMMNNGRYILQKIKGSTEINTLMGDKWCRKRSSDLRQYHQNYKRETWGKLLNCLTHEGLLVNGKVLKPVLKERFKSFNAIFDDIHKNQSTWIVTDEQLQSELRVSISAVVIPAYRSFMGRFSQYLTAGRQSEKYIKYQPEDIETHIDELFDGNASTNVGRRRL